MGTFLYFGYGSNLLAQWLGQKVRCPSCKPMGISKVEGYALSFDKKSKDGSGKATINPKVGSFILGRVFEIADGELDPLDRAEGKGYGYDRDDNFVVKLGEERRTTSTYIGTNLAQAQSVKPYDWYLALVVAGGIQGGLPDEYVAGLRSTGWMIEPPSSLEKHRVTELAVKKQEAIAALKAAGFGSIQSVLEP